MGLTGGFDSRGLPTMRTPRCWSIAVVALAVAAVFVVAGMPFAGLAVAWCSGFVAALGRRR